MAATYCREKTCIEDIVAIANEIARGPTRATALNGKRNETYRKTAEARKETH